MVTCPSPKITAGLLSQRNGSRATGQLGCLAFGKDNARGRLENGGVMTSMQHNHGIAISNPMKYPM